MSNPKSKPGQVIWMVGGGPMQKFAARHIKKLGYLLLTTDKNPNADCRELSDFFYQIDSQDWLSHLALAPHIHGVVGVTCIATDAHFTVAKLVEFYGLLGISPKVSTAIGNKHEARKRLKSIGLPQPRYHRLTEEMEERVIKSVLIEVPEWVCKPIGYSGSHGIQLISTSDNEIGVLVKKIKDTCTLSRDGSAILEERLMPDGKFSSESSVEVLAHGKKLTLLNFVDRIFQPDLGSYLIPGIPKWLGLGVEFGHINPTQRSHKEQALVLTQIEKFLKSLKLDYPEIEDIPFILKADIYFSNTGPIILEMTPRTSGGWDSSYSSILLGKMTQELALRLAVGIDYVDTLNNIKDAITKVGSFVAVVSDADETFVSSIGRDFFGGGVSSSPFEALYSAIRTRTCNVPLGS